MILADNSTAASTVSQYAPALSLPTSIAAAGVSITVYSVSYSC